MKLHLPKALMTAMAAAMVAATPIAMTMATGVLVAASQAMAAEVITVADQTLTGNAPYTMTHQVEKINSIQASGTELNVIVLNDNNRNLGIGNLSIIGDNELTINAPACDVVVIGDLTGDGTLTLNRNNGGSSPWTWGYSISLHDLNTENSNFTGTIRTLNNGANPGNGNALQVYLMAQDVAKDATVELGIKSTLAVSTSLAKVAGLTSTQSTAAVVSLANPNGAQSLDTLGDTDNNAYNSVTTQSTNDATARTLELTGARTYAYAGAIGSSSNSSSLNLTKSGTGTQTLSGTNHIGVLNVTGGKLTLGSSSTIHGNATVGANSELEMLGSYIITSTTSTVNGTVSVATSTELKEGAQLTVNSGGKLTTDTLRIHNSGVAGTDTLTIDGGIVNVKSTLLNTDVHPSSGYTDIGRESGIIVGHWDKGKGILTIKNNGVLNAYACTTTVSWDSAGEMDIESGGEANLACINSSGRNTSSGEVYLKGGRLNIGSGGYIGSGDNSHLNISAGYTGSAIGILASSVSIQEDLQVDADLTIDTQVYTPSDTGKATAVAGSYGEISLSGGITGTGAVSVTGTGTLNLSKGTEGNFQSDLTVADGTLKTTSAAKNFHGTVTAKNLIADSDVTFNEGATVTGSLTGSGTVTVASDKTLELALTGTHGISNTISGTGDLVVSGGDITLSGTSVSFKGISIAAESTLDISAGTLYLGGTIDNDGALTIGGDIYVSNVTGFTPYGTQSFSDGTDGFLQSTTYRLYAHAENVSVSADAVHLAGADDVTYALSQDGLFTVDATGSSDYYVNTSVTYTGDAGAAGADVHTLLLNKNASLTLAQELKTYTEDGTAHTVNIEIIDSGSTVALNAGVTLRASEIASAAGYRTTLAGTGIFDAETNGSTSIPSTVTLGENWQGAVQLTGNNTGTLHISEFVNAEHTSAVKFVPATGSTTVTINRIDSNGAIIRDTKGAENTSGLSVRVVNFDSGELKLDNSYVTVNGTFDMRGAPDKSGWLKLVNGSTMKVDISLWMYNNSRILVEDTSKFIQGGFELTKTSTATTAKVQTTDTNASRNLCDSDHTTITDAKLLYKGTGATTISAVLVDTDVETAAGAGVLTLNTANVRNLRSANSVIIANNVTVAGDIFLTNGKNITINAGKSLSNDNFTYTAGAASGTITKNSNSATDGYSGDTDRVSPFYSTGTTVSGLTMKQDASTKKTVKMVLSNVDFESAYGATTTFNATADDTLSSMRLGSGSSATASSSVTVGGETTLSGSAVVKNTGAAASAFTMANSDYTITSGNVTTSATSVSAEMSGVNLTTTAAAVSVSGTQDLSGLKIANGSTLSLATDAKLTHDDVTYSGGASITNNGSGGGVSLWNGSFCIAGGDVAVKGENRDVRAQFSGSNVAYEGTGYLILNNTQDIQRLELGESSNGKLVLGSTYNGTVYTADAGVQSAAGVKDIEFNHGSSLTVKGDGVTLGSATEAGTISKVSGDTATINIEAGRTLHISNDTVSGISFSALERDGHGTRATLEISAGEALKGCVEEGASGNAPTTTTSLMKDCSLQATDVVISAAGATEAFAAEHNHTLGTPYTLDIMSGITLAAGDSFTLTLVGLENYTDVKLYWSSVGLVRSFGEGDATALAGTVDLDANGIGSMAYNGGAVLFESTSGTVVNVWATYNIPEPTTATLSVLALAGLAARRRRKR